MTASQRRRVAATYRMIDKLPKAGALVVVHAHSAISPIRDLIVRRRGDVIARDVRVVAAPTENDEVAIAGGTELPVFREPFVEEARAHAIALAEARGPALLRLRP